MSQYPKKIVTYKTSDGHEFHSEEIAISRQKRLDAGKDSALLLVNNFCREHDLVVDSKSVMDWVNALSTESGKALLDNLEEVRQTYGPV